ncbi:sigma-54 interaction domain-containing protein [Inmirania thermothiophila]|uniref:Fis family sigma54 specific transcriptional regulator n=1 Tax=Inmirania thermothiophila TaxID=1750597 RepID=A0A3N1Y5U2_9GAMM|nr:sigma-54-dependent Fis family transcriptional regulator [Inmirania thermothiophila]ROR32667.1 Fis family sigma54 specific transcriptional regulator [Inmirania thermothiophila]
MPSALRQPSCRQVLDLLPEPFVVIDRDYRIVAANQAYLRRYGVAAGEVEGRRCHEISHRSQVPCSRNGEICPLETSMATGRPAQVLHVHFDRGGRAERVELVVTPIVEGGEVAFVGERIRPLADPDDAAELLVGRSQPMLEVLALLRRVAQAQVTVLLTGESGVGKEQAARYLHHQSSRAGGPFVVVDCSTLSPNLIESELFGHEKGAFTGASTSRKGLFEAAHGGTLFIDEVGELPMELQARLLRALEVGAVRRVGSTHYRRVDVRVVVATHRDLVSWVRSGRFRADLYYRLAAFPVRVPALREHLEDVPALAEHFLRRMEGGGRFLPLAEGVVERLMSYPYPGNVRELRNIVERAVVLAGDGPIEPEHVVFPEEPTHKPDPEPQGKGRLRRMRSPGPERIREALQRAEGHRGRAAAELGISERTLYRYLRRMRADGD